MIAEELINEMIPALSMKDKAEKAISAVIDAGWEGQKIYLTFFRLIW